MKSKKIYLLALVLSQFLMGCIRTYYPAIYQTSSYPMIYNQADSTRKIVKYLSADLTISNGNYHGESIQLFKCNYVMANTNDYYNNNLRVFGYAGNYRVQGLDEYNGNKTAFGLGGEFSTSMNVKIYSLKIGIGINAGIACEIGCYYNFRKKIGNSESKLVFGTFSAFPVISYNLSKSSVLSAQTNIGVPGLLSPTIVLNNNNYIYWLSWVSNYQDRESIFGNRLVLGFMININNL